MNSHFTKVLAVIICFGTISMNAMDRSPDALSKRKDTLITSKKTTGSETFQAITSVTVVDYESVRAAKEAGPQVVALEEVKIMVQVEHEQNLPLYRKYPKTTLVCVGGVCFTLGLFFPEIRSAVTEKLASSSTNSIE